MEDGLTTKEVKKILTKLEALEKTAEEDVIQLKEKSGKPGFAKKLYLDSALMKSGQAAAFAISREYIINLLNSKTKI